MQNHWENHVVYIDIYIIKQTYMYIYIYISHRTLPQRPVMQKQWEIMDI